jgi:biotin synthase
MNKFEKILNQNEFSREDIIYLLNLTDEKEIKLLFKKADAVRQKFVGSQIHFRGVIEFSNYCSQHCLYCGLREDNFALQRYRMSTEEIIETAKIIYSNGIKTIVLQSGEDSFFDTDLISYLIYSIKNQFDVAITLSIGERNFDEYRAWKIAGADRYLMKHETANKKLYYAIHSKASLEDRINHLKYLKNLGYQVGTGNMIGLPGQKTEDIADDILICKKLDVDMAAFGPFIPSPFTPFQSQKAGSADLTLKTMAVARLVLKDVNIPATTALDSIDHIGREKGLSAGANVVMPNFTPKPYRENYQIYSNKRGITDDPIESYQKIRNRVLETGREISSSYGERHEGR